MGDEISAGDRNRSVPEEISLDSCWRHTPCEGSTDFFFAYRAVAKSVQRALRFQLPAILFADSERFRDLRWAYPTLIYASSRPFRGRSRSELAYDVLDTTAMQSFYRLCQPGLRMRLSGIADRLHREGKDDVAHRYLPRRTPDIVAAVRKSNRGLHRLHALLFAEANLINELTHLAGLGKKDEDAQARTVMAFWKAWNAHLRRMSGPDDPRELSEALIRSAEDALTRELDRAAR